MNVFLRSMNFRRAVSLGICGIAFWAALSNGLLRADEIKLRRGGSLKGIIQKTPEENGGYYEILLETGGLLKLLKNEVDSVVAPQSSTESYQAELKKHDLSSVEGHLNLAKWCQENKLRVQKTKHLRKVIELDPDQSAARRLLGYTRHLHTGKWVLRDEYYQSIGYVGNGTTMRLPAALLVESEQKKHRDAVIQWKGKIPRLITLLKNPRKFAEAKSELEEIEDVKSIAVLIDIYTKTGKKKQFSQFDRETRSLLMSIIAKFEILSAKAFLVNVALYEMDDVLQDEALRVLKSKHAPWTAEYLIARLNRIPPALTTMIHDRQAAEQLEFIGRAAAILQELETDVSEAILPLINLVYINRVLVPVAQPKRGGLGGATFSKNGGVGLNQGSEKPKPRAVQIEVELARIALVKLTEQRLGYNKGAWLDWYLSKSIPPRVDLRRLDESQ